MINRGIYIIIIGIILYCYNWDTWGYLSWFKVTFFGGVCAGEFWCNHQAKKPVFRPPPP